MISCSVCRSSSGRRSPTAGKVRSIHSSSIADRIQSRVPGQPAERVQVGLGQRVPGPERVVAHVGRPRPARRRPRLRRARRPRSARRPHGAEPQHLAPHRAEVAHVPLLAGVLLGHLQLHRQPGARASRRSPATPAPGPGSRSGRTSPAGSRCRGTARRAGRSGRTRRGPGRSTGPASPGGGCRRTPASARLPRAGPARRRACSRRRRGCARTRTGRAAPPSRPSPRNRRSRGSARTPAGWSRPTRPAPPRPAGRRWAGPPSRTGAAKLTDRCTRMPYGRSTSAIPATSPSRSVSSCASVGCTLTLFTATR